MICHAPRHLADIPIDVMPRFFAFVEVDKATGCWLWTGYTDRKGYGQFRLGERMHWAHRVAHAAFVGPIPDGMQIDHLCEVTSCCNPEHLEAVTLEENRRRQAQRKARAEEEIPF